MKHIYTIFRAMRPYVWTKLVGAAARNRVLWPVVDSYIEVGARRSGIIVLCVICFTITLITFTLITLRQNKQNWLHVYAFYMKNDVKAPTSKVVFIVINVT